MKSKCDFGLIGVGIIVGIIMNVEAIVLQSYITIEEQYMSSIFPFNLFLEQKQYFVSFKIMIVSLLYMCLIVNEMKRQQMPYILLRVKKKYWWEYKLTYGIVKSASLFYLGYTLIIFIMSVFISEGMLTMFAWKVWCLSWLSLIYLGIILGCFVNFLVSFLNAQTAVIITYILFLAGNYETMQYSDVFIKSKILLYLNPVTAISIVEEELGVNIIFAILGMCVIAYVCRCMLALVYVRWEKCVEGEN